MRAAACCVCQCLTALGRHWHAHSPHSKALKERHAQEQAELDQRNRDEFRVFTQGWEEKRAELTRTIQAQEEQ